jgi:two-component system phosphate regulon sensor histidine kinase PhoR
MKFIRKSLGRKLALAYGILFALVFASVYFYSTGAVEKRGLEQLEESLTHQAFLAGHAFIPQLGGTVNPARLEGLARELGKGIKARLTVIGPDGGVLADSDVTDEKITEMDNHRHRPEFELALNGKTGASVRYSKTLKIKMLYVAIPLRKEGALLGALRLALPLTTVQDILRSIAHPLAAGLLTGLLLVVLLSMALSRSITARVKRLTVAVQRYAAGHLGRKIYLRSSDELETLATAMNQMAATLRERIGEIESERAKFSAVLNNMAEGVIAVDHNNIIMVVNPCAEKIFCIRTESACGRSLIEAVRHKRLAEMAAQAVDEQGFISGEFELPQFQGKVLRVSALGISKSEGTVAGILVISDISEIRRLENVRREFVANVSHELRTPLTSIRGFIETLRGGTVTDPSRSREFLKIMEEDAVRLTKLIDDLLDLSRIEAEGSGLKQEPLGLVEQISAVAALLKPRLDEKKIEFKNLTTENKETLVLADAGALRQVLMNLFENAIKFNSVRGKISVRAKKVDRMIEVSIEDTGCGIPEADIPRIFERFYRVDKARSRELGGTGLGLSIVKHIIEAHGGKVSCQSTLGRGSSFIFTIPAALQ